MNKYLIRFNKSRGQDGRGTVDHVWRVFENGTEYLVKELNIQVPTVSEQSGEDWNISCSGFMSIDSNETAVITPFPQLDTGFGITKYPALLSEQDFNYVVNKTVEGNTWEFNGRFNDKVPNTFWFMELDQDPFFTAHMFSVIKKATQREFELLKVYANGQTYGTPSGLHTDDPRSGYFTFLYYANPVWHVEWGGFTVFAQPPNKHETILPEPNTGVLFPSSVWHHGMEPAKHYPGLRVTVAYKLKALD